MRLIPVGNLHAAVDDRDYERVSSVVWSKHVSLNRRSIRYYARRVDKSFGRRRTIYMHREILGAQRGVQVDHRDGNGLNNRRRNIRPCTQAQNNANSRPRGKSGYKGVTPSLLGMAGPNPWKAEIKSHGKRTYLGVFATAKEAALAYDTAARKTFGEFARTNFQ